jgi:hypothetical protein
MRPFSRGTIGVGELGRGDRHHGRQTAGHDLQP